MFSLCCFKLVGTRYTKFNVLGVIISLYCHFWIFACDIRMHLWQSLCCTWTCVFTYSIAVFTLHYSILYCCYWSMRPSLLVLYCVTLYCIYYIACWLQICDAIFSGSATRVWNDDAQVPYAYLDRTWVGYDDTESLHVKVSRQIPMWSFILYLLCTLYLILEQKTIRAYFTSTVDIARLAETQSAHRLVKGECVPFSMCPCFHLPFVKCYSV